MTDLFLEAGFTYFDTAFVYLGSEAAVRKALVERHPRDSYTLATKLNVLVAPSEKAARKQFETSLSRTGAGYFDFYLLHALMDSNWEKYEKLHLWEFVQEQKAKGLIRHIGFSFHGGPALLDRLLTGHPETEFVQLQINYADWENPRVTARANYEVARRHGKPIVVMEPVKGGTLAEPPEEVKKRMKACHPDRSPASWAIRFAASLDGVMTVLSGMSNLAQMKDNLSFMKDFRPLDGEEQAILQEAAGVIGKTNAIPCTACRYCTAGCPKKIPIPEIFSSMNQHLGGKTDAARRHYRKAVKAGGRASDCIRCGLCEKACPQHISIRTVLESCSQVLERGKS